MFLNEEITRLILSGSKRNISFFDGGIENRKNVIRSAALSRFFTRRGRRLAGIRTCNFAFWKQDALKVNGFNEDFIGWGREDREFAARLFLAGLYGRNYKFKAVAYHLYHPERKKDSLQGNQDLLENTIDSGQHWCENGISKYL